MNRLSYMLFLSDDTRTHLLKLAANIAAFFICVFGCLYLMSDFANAETSDEQSEIIALRKIVAGCLTEGAGMPIKIGDDWFLCGISPLGKF